MRYVSTRGQSKPIDFRETIVAGLAPDGGLYVPETFPEIKLDQGVGYVDAVATVLEAFSASDPHPHVEKAAAAFHSPVVAPIVEVGDRLVLELFHGPTLSFKDHALQVLGRLLRAEIEEGTILGATSGDTGSAAIEAFRGASGLKAVILFPEGRVSEFQRRQMTTVAESNVVAVAVRGTFDDCQRMVKESFARMPNLLAVNSINWGRVAAQAGYHFYAASQMDEPVDVVIPTGNFGNAYSCWVAREMGAPIDGITIANNANHGLSDLVNRRPSTAGEVIPTMAPAMDIRLPSNLERMTADPAAEFRASWSSDEEIARTIDEVADDHGYLIDPHTATAWRAAELTAGPRRQLVVATAHPAKFDDEIAPPECYPNLSDLEERVVTIAADTSELIPLLR